MFFNGIALTLGKFYYSGQVSIRPSSEWIGKRPEWFSHLNMPTSVYLSLSCKIKALLNNKDKVRGVIWPSLKNINSTHRYGSVTVYVEVPKRVSILKMTAKRTNVENSLDAILYQLGDFGKYQILVFSLVCVAVILHSVVHIAYVFTAMDLNYRYLHLFFVVTCIWITSGTVKRLNWEHVLL